VLLAMMAVAMMAVSVSAWGQEDAAQADGSGGSVGASATGRGDPVIKPLNPKPGEKITDTTPRIKADVFHGASKVNKNGIRLWLDNHRIGPKKFFYSHHDPVTSNERLRFIPDENLSPGKHTVKITAVQHRDGDRTTRRWSFRIVD
jgi:hypothetical protein